MNECQPLHLQSNKKNNPFLIKTNNILIVHRSYDIILERNIFSESKCCTTLKVSSIVFEGKESVRLIPLMVKNVTWLIWEAGPFHCMGSKSRSHLRLPASVQESPSSYTAPTPFPLI